MSNKLKYFIKVAFVITLVTIIALNSVTIIEWLNRSLFADFAVDADWENNFVYAEIGLIALFMILLYSLFGTLSITVISTNMIFGALIIANNIKVKERNEFITFSELQTITSPKELLSFVEIPIAVATLVVVLSIVIIVITQYGLVKLSKKVNLWPTIKVRSILFAISFLAITIILIKPNTFNENFLHFEESTGHNFNPVVTARKKGFIPSFIHTVKPNYMNTPSHYSKENVKDIFKKYEGIANEINQERDKPISDSQTILYLSESLIDPMFIPDLLHNETPIPFITNTSNEGAGGTIYSQYIGGGTANIEWSILTSFSLEVFNSPISVTPYSDFYVQSKNHNTFLSLFDNKEKIAIHPYSAHLYKRRSVYDAIGFNDFLYLNNGIEHTDKLGTHRTVSDEALNKDIFKSAAKDNVGLLHVLSMQNHSPYTGEIPDMDYEPNINTDIYPKDREKELFNYLQGLKASDEAIKDLVHEIDESDEEVNLLFYGDHFPNLFTNLEEQFSEKEIHETPWFVYMNHDRSEPKEQIKNLSPAFLTTVILREGNYYVSPLQGLMDKLLSKDIKRIGKNFVITEEGVTKDEDLPEELKEMIHDYRTIMYDALFGKNWLKNEFYTVDI